MHRTSQTSDVMTNDPKPLTYQYGALGSTHHPRQKTILRPMQRLQCEDVETPRVHSRNMSKTIDNTEAAAMRKASARNPA